MRTKVTVAYLLIAVGAFVMLCVYLTRQAGDYMLAAKIREEQARSMEYAQQLDSWRQESSLWARTAELAGQGGARALVVDEMGVVQADSESLSDGSRLDRPEVVEALSGEAAYGWYASSERFIPWRTLLSSGELGLSILYAAPLDTGGALVYIAPADPLYESLFWFQARAFALGLAASLAVCLLTARLMKRFTRPVDQLSEGIEKIAHGDLSSRIEVRGHNEFSELARTFNSMCEQLETLDKARNQFVSDASHELKTPLSTMKILIETLLYQDPMDPELAKEFLGDANKEIDRLSGIIQDLLTLVHMDSGDAPMKMTEVSLSDVVSDTVSRLLPLSRERGIEMNCLIRDQITVQGNAVKLSQVCYNLIDNALKYTPRGGLVRMELAKNGKKAVFRVADNGVGIPAEDKQRVFDRFYRVDKTRSRETGGTGLGLAIVKQIVQMHGGDVSLESEEGKGSTFEVTLPCA